jgi:hypothetical protein
VDAPKNLRTPQKTGIKKRFREGRTVLDEYDLNAAAEEHARRRERQDTQRRLAQACQAQCPDSGKENLEHLLMPYEKPGHKKLSSNIMTTMLVVGNFEPHKWASKLYDQAKQRIDATKEEKNLARKLAEIRAVLDLLSTIESRLADFSEYFSRTSDLPYLSLLKPISEAIEQYSSGLSSMEKNIHAGLKNQAGMQKIQRF